MKAWDTEWGNGDESRTLAVSVGELWVVVEESGRGVGCGREFGLNKALGDDV